MTDAAVTTVGSVGLALDVLENMTGSIEALSSRAAGLANLVERLNDG